MFAPTWTLLHTFNRHDHHHHDHPHHHHHHIMIIISLKFATPSEQYVDSGKHQLYLHWGFKICHPLWTTCWLGYIITSTLSSWGIKICHPALNNMLMGVITSTISPWGIKIRHPLSSWGIKFCQPLWKEVDWGKNINFIFIRDQNLPPALNNILIGVITSTSSS